MFFDTRDINWQLHNLLQCVQAVDDPISGYEQQITTLEKQSLF